MLGRYAERAYLEYAMSVVKAALPEVSDGQKPVQRRICLFLMRDMGLTAGAKRANRHAWSE